jgi:predicted N-acetyltransferase YhbS
VPLRVERLDPDRHDRSTFSCGVRDLDRYLKEQATQDERRFLTSVFVVVEEGDGEVLGYYSLSAYGVRVQELPEDVRRKLPSYPIIPAFLLGRLAVRLEVQGRRLGEFLLVDALERCAASEIRGWAVLVEATNDDAAAFYRRYEFRPLPDAPNRFAMPMSLVRTL